MTLAFIDTETTGIPDYSLPVDHPDQPSIVQVAIILTDDTGEVVKQHYKTLVRPMPFCKWSAQAEAVHGISQKRAQLRGMRPEFLATDIMQLTEGATIIAHNAQFDGFLVSALLSHFAATADLCRWRAKRVICTMLKSAPILKLPRKGNRHDFHEQAPGDYKMPRLAEAYRFFTGSDLEGAHDAMADAEACRQVYLGIQRHRAQEGVA